MMRIRPRNVARELRYLPFATALMALGIFVMDTVTSRPIAVAGLYVAVVLLAVNFAKRRGVILIAFGCITLTVVSYLLTPIGDVEDGIVNSFISILAISATAYLAQRIQAAQIAADRAQSQLAHISRVTTLGELAASIAHEVNQPLGAVVTNGNAALRWLSAEPPNISEAIKTIEYIVDDADRASEVIARLRSLVRRAPPKPTLLNADDVVKEITSLMQSELRRNYVELRLELASGLPSIRGDRIQLQQVLLNLLLNAIEVLNSTNASVREVVVRTALSDDRKGVAITVSDTGSGISAADSERIFEPYYSTKPSGMGVGLAISRSIVEAHGGRIQAMSNMPRGTTIQVLLPAVFEVQS